MKDGLWRVVCGGFYNCFEDTFWRKSSTKVMKRESLGFRIVLDIPKKLNKDG